MNAYLFSFDFICGNTEYYFNRLIRTELPIDAINTFLDIIDQPNVETIADFYNLNYLEDDNHNIFKNINYERIK